jgi:cytochrome c
MKKTFLILSTITIFLAACGGSTSEGTDASSTAPATAPTVSKAAMHPGELLIVKADCIGCHHKENKIIGPAYQDIAAKYPSTPENIDMLANSILKGSKGKWGTIPMTPHPNATLEDAKLMATYILSLKK